MPAMSEANNPVPPVLSKSDQNLVWLDCEMTGLEPDTDRLLEIAVIVTGPQLEPSIVISHCPYCYRVSFIR